MSTDINEARYIRLTFYNQQSDSKDSLLSFRDTVVSPYIFRNLSERDGIAYVGSIGYQGEDEVNWFGLEFRSAVTTEDAIKQLQQIAQSPKLQQMFGANAAINVSEEAVSIIRRDGVEACDNITIECYNLENHLNGFLL